LLLAFPNLEIFGELFFSSVYSALVDTCPGFSSSFGSLKERETSNTVIIFWFYPMGTGGSYPGVK